MSLRTLGSSIIILLAAVKDVPQELHDSAKVDGAGSFQVIRSIALPMINGSLFFLVIINTIAGFQTFTEANTAFFGSGNTTYINDGDRHWELVVTASVITTVPMIILFFLGQRHFVEGIATTGNKG
ncbi:ABC-type glycerol-3-phosphate transport system permease component [Arthrobacter sp. CAN_A6]